MRQESAGAAKVADFLLSPLGRSCVIARQVTLPHPTARRPRQGDGLSVRTTASPRLHRLVHEIMYENSRRQAQQKTIFKNVHQSSNSWQGDCEKRLICTIARPMSSWAPTTSVAPLMMLRFSSSCNEQQLRTVSCRVFRDLHGKLQAG